MVKLCILGSFESKMLQDKKRAPRNRTITLDAEEQVKYKKGYCD